MVNSGNFFLTKFRLNRWAIFSRKKFCPMPKNSPNLVTLRWAVGEALVRDKGPKSTAPRNPAQRRETPNFFARTGFSLKNAAFFPSKSQLSSCVRQWQFPTGSFRR
jgi:hypothetical protein